MRKVNAEDFREWVIAHPEWELGTLQVALYVAVGGGSLGEEFAHHPASPSAYMDDRVNPRPYSRSKIEALRQCLITMAEARGLDPLSLPNMPVIPTIPIRGGIFG